MLRFGVECRIPYRRPDDIPLLNIDGSGDQIESKGLLPSWVDNILLVNILLELTLDVVLIYEKIQARTFTFELEFRFFYLGQHPNPSSQVFRDVVHKLRSMRVGDHRNQGVHQCCQRETIRL